MSTSRGAFRAGVLDMLPVVPGFVAFGTITGATMVEVGFSPCQAALLNLFVYDGSTELAMANLVRESAPAAVVSLTGLLVLLRYAMVSAALAPHLRSSSLRARLGGGVFLSMAAYVLAVTKFESEESLERLPYYLGAAVPMWASWQVSFVAGVLVGALIPPGWHLEFTFPLVFLALLFPTIEDRPTVVAALVAGPTALLAGGFPASTGLLAAILVGVAAGFLVSRRDR